MRLAVRIVVAALGAAASACVSAVPAELRAPRQGAAVLPAGGPSFWVFERSRVARHEDGRVVWEEGHVDEGDPSAAAVDLFSGWACVAYPSRLVWIELAARQLHAVDNPLGAIDGVAVRGETAALWSGTRVVALRVPSGELLWQADLAEHLDRFDVNHLAFLLPCADDELVLIASREGDSFTDGFVLAQRIDRSRGDWRVPIQNRLPALTWAHRTTSHGEAVFVAGLWEATQLRPGSAGRLWQSLAIYRIDLDTLEATELVLAERQARQTVVRDLAVGPEALAVLLDAGTVQIYRITEDGGATAPLYERRFDRVDSIAWISDQELVVMTPSGPEIARY